MTTQSPVLYRCVATTEHTPVNILDAQFLTYGSDESSNWGDVGHFTVRLLDMSTEHLQSLSTICLPIESR